MGARINNSSSHFCYVANGKLYCCGTNTSYCLGDLVALGGVVESMTQVGTLDTWAHVSCGVNNTVAIKTDGTMWVMGANANGQLGTGDTNTVTTLTQSGNGTSDWATSASGTYVCMAIKTDGTMWGAGANNSGAIGCAGSGNILSFTQESGLATNWSSVDTAGSSISNTYVMAINTLGELWTSGNNNSSAQGQGAGYTVFTKVGTATDWEYVSAADEASAVLKTTGVVHAAGWKYYWTGENGWQATHAAIDARAYASVALGFYNIVLAGDDGVVYVSGDNLRGQLGTTDYSGLDFGYPIASPTSPSSIIEVFANTYHSYALSSTAMYTAGDPYDGGTATGDANPPLEITTFTLTDFILATPGAHYYEDVADSANSSSTTAPVTSVHILTADSAEAVAALTDQIVNWLYDNALATGQYTHRANTTSSLMQSFSSTDAIRSIVEMIISETADGSDAAAITAASVLVDLLTASGVYTTRLDAINAVAQVVALSDLMDKTIAENILESAAFAEATTRYVKAIEHALVEADAAETLGTYFFLTGNLSDIADAQIDLPIGQILNGYITESVAGFIRLDIGGEVYTGWVMNTQIGAVTEYQGLSFNSLARIGGAYYGASDTGIHKLVDENSDVNTYIQSGMLDFGTPQYKSATNAYLAVDVDGRIAVGVSVSEKTGTAQYWYDVSMDKEAPDNVKLPIGRGLKGRYWKFEVASESMDTFEAMTVLPVVLTRKV